MAVLEGARAAAAGVALATNQSEFIVVGILPDVCWTSGVPVPYPITAKLDYNSIAVSGNVNFCGLPAFTENSRVLQVTGNEPGLEGGVVSTTNLGYCRPVPGLNSSTVRVNGAMVDYNIGTLMHMNCLGPEGPGNTLGILLFTGPMIPGPVTASGKIPSSFLSAGGLLDQLKGYYKTAKGIYDGAKKFYDIVNIDWSNPGAVLGAIGGVAGFAGLEGMQRAAKLAQQANAIAQTDFSDPRSLFGAVGQLGAIAGYRDVIAAASAAQQAHDILKTDWDNPQAVQAALASMGRIARLSGLDVMAAEMAHKAATGESIELDSPPNLSKLQSGFMPKLGKGIGKAADFLGGSSDLPMGGNALAPQASISKDGRLPNLYNQAIQPQTPAEAAFLAANKNRQQADPVRTTGANISESQLKNMQQQNPVAFERYSMLSEEDKQKAIIENSGNKMAIFLPGEGFSSTRDEIDSGPLLFDVPDRVKEVFVSDGTENFFGIKQKKGNWYLFGGAIDLGSPEMPGAGTTSTWFVPDRILWADMSDYFAYHDENYYGDEVRLSDLGKILSLEGKAFAAGAKLDPLQLPLQALYSAATTTVGVGTAAYNSLKDFYDATFDSVSNTLSAAGEDLAGIMDGSGLSDIGDNVLGQFGLGDNPAQTPAPGGGNGAGSGTGGSGGKGGSGSAAGSKPVKQGQSASLPIDGILITKGGYATAGLSAVGLLGGASGTAGADTKNDSGPSNGSNNDEEEKTNNGKPSDEQNQKTTDSENVPEESENDQQQEDADDQSRDENDSSETEDSSDKTLDEILAAEERDQAAEDKKIRDQVRAEDPYSGTTTEELNDPSLDEQLEPTAPTEQDEVDSAEPKSVTSNFDEGTITVTKDGDTTTTTVHYDKTNQSVVTTEKVIRQTVDEGFLIDQEKTVLQRKVEYFDSNGNPTGGKTEPIVIENKYTVGEIGGVQFGMKDSVSVGGQFRTDGGVVADVGASAQFGVFVETDKKESSLAGTVGASVGGGAQSTKFGKNDGEGSLSLGDRLGVGGSASDIANEQTYDVNIGPVGVQTNDKIKPPAPE